MSSADTIAAIATAAGRGGIGVVRVSGRLAQPIAHALGLNNVAPRHARFATFRGREGGAIDQGVALFFSGPHSFTGEDVLELQGHGGSAVLRALLARVCELGARLAAPGEFTQRAFLNDKIDLAQAEAVADLIDAATAAAAQSAARSLVGEFSQAVNALAAKLVELRMHVEAAIDFPEEEIDPADRAWQAARIAAIAGDLGALTRAASQGQLLRDGVTVALVGPPNVGKSSLLNRLVGEEVAIVTPIAGTTRDPVRAHIAIGGVPFHLVDTAGLRQTDDPVEAIGIARTQDELARASLVLVLSAWGEAETAVPAEVPARAAVVRVVNKADRASATVPDDTAVLDGTTDAVYVSALTGEGIEGLRQRLLSLAGAKPSEEGVFMARQRHLDALALCGDYVAAAQEKLTIAHELMAEDLRMAHRALKAITGEFSPDDLLGEIFSRFCIGK